jgi:adenylate kinase
LLCSRLSLAHLSMGDLLRKEIEANTPLGLAIRDVLASGDFVDEECIQSVLHARFAKPDLLSFKGILFDGIPRTLQQARFLDSFLKETGRCVDIVVHIVISDHVLIDRLAGRFLCAGCHAVYHKNFKPLHTLGQCDFCQGSDFYSRDDDQERIVTKRLLKHKAEVQPVLDWYCAQGRLVSVDGDGPVHLVSGRILKALGEAV